MNKPVTKAVICLALIVIAVVSFFPIAQRYTSPERYTDYVASIDEKTETVLKLMAASTVTSAGITAIPGDTATPIAEKLADFSEYFLLILCVLYAEKYLLTIIPYGVFKGLIPLTCALFIAGRIWNPRLLDKQGFKLLLIGIALLLVIPLSVRTSDMIYNTYKESIDSTLASAEALTDETTELSEAQQGWRNVLCTAMQNGVPAPCMTAGLQYYDGYRCGRLPANLLQAQRDFFGAHTYERTDRPRGEFFHTNWTGHGGSTISSTYNA